MSKRAVGDEGACQENRSKEMDAIDAAEAVRERVVGEVELSSELKSKSKSMPMSMAEWLSPSRGAERENESGGAEVKTKTKMKTKTKTKTKMETETEEVWNPVGDERCPFLPV